MFHVSVTNPSPLSGSWSSDHWDTAPCILANHILVPWSRLLFHSCGGVMPKWIIITTELFQNYPSVWISLVFILLKKNKTSVRQHVFYWEHVNNGRCTQGVHSLLEKMRWMHGISQYVFQVRVTEQQSLSVPWDLRGMVRWGCYCGDLSRGWRQMKRQRSPSGIKQEEKLELGFPPSM